MNLYESIKNNLKESLAELSVGKDYSHDDKEIEARLNSFEKSIDNFCDNTNFKKVKNLYEISRPFKTDLDGIWYKQDLILPDNTEGDLIFNPMSNICYVNFDNSDLYHWHSGLFRFENNLDKFAKEVNDVKYLNKLNDKLYKDEIRAVVSRIASYIMDKHSRKVYKNFPRKSKNDRIRIRECYARDFLNLSKEKQMDIVKEYFDEAVNNVSSQEKNFKFFNDDDLKNITYDLVYEELLDNANLFKPSEYSEELFGKLYEPQLF